MYISQRVAWHRFQGKTSGFTTAAESGVHRGHCFFSRNYPRVCHFIFCLFFNQHLGICCSVAKSCPTLWPHVLQPPRLLCPWDFLGKNSGVGCHFLLQGIFPTLGSNPALVGGLFITESTRETPQKTYSEIPNNHCLRRTSPYSD